MNKVKRAIILAAGKGTRMAPLTNTTPKPLIKISGEPIIERTIKVLLSKNINEIYIITGYLADQFDYLKDKFGITLINNPHYDTCNNISSLFVARKYLTDAIVLEGDIWINNDSIILTEFDYSGYTSIWSDYETSEWLQSVDDADFMTSCSRTGGKSGWILYGISYWAKKDAIMLSEDIENEFVNKQNTNIYWDDVAIFCYPEKYKLKIKRTDSNSFKEFDCVADIEAYNKHYK